MTNSANACPKDMLIFCIFKAALSVTFDLLILELMFLYFKNTVKN